MAIVFTERPLLDEDITLPEKDLKKIMDANKETLRSYIVKEESKACKIKFTKEDVLNEAMDIFEPK